jgi:hypothetical protein
MDLSLSGVVVVGPDSQHPPRRNRVAAIRVLDAAVVAVPELDLDRAAVPGFLSAAAPTAYRAGGPAADSSVGSAVLPKGPPFHRATERKCGLLRLVPLQL